jgi:hypothetical protein
MNQFMRANRPVTGNADFAEISNLLLNRTLLMVNGAAHRICEIEFYLFSSTHEDIYAHRNPDQLEYGYFYFHKHGSGYRGGSYKGMDLTLGMKQIPGIAPALSLRDKQGYNSTNELSYIPTYCGILFRSIYDFGEQRMISGPSLSVDHILQKCGAPNIQTLTGGQLLSALNAQYLHLQDLTVEISFPDVQIHHAPRIGLKAKEAVFHQAYYRYGVLTKLIKKEKTKFRALTTDASLMVFPASSVSPLISSQTSNAIQFIVID